MLFCLWGIKSGWETIVYSPHVVIEYGEGVFCIHRRALYLCAITTLLPSKNRREMKVFISTLKDKVISPHLQQFTDVKSFKYRVLHISDGT